MKVQIVVLSLIASAMALAVPADSMIPDFSVTQTLNHADTCTDALDKKSVGNTVNLGNNLAVRYDEGGYDGDDEGRG